MIKKLKEFIYLGRYQNPTGALLLAYPCFWGIALATQNISEIIFYTIVFCLGAFCMRAAGCAWNDIVDRDIDIKVSRTKNRPIASGKISIKEAIQFILFNSFIGLCILFFFNQKAIIISLLSLPLAIIYPLTKRVTYFPQIWLGITFNIGLLISYTCLTNEYPNLSILIIYTGSIFWTLGYDTLYALQDIEDDIKNNIKSIAVKLKQYSGVFSSIFYIIFTILFCMGIFVGKYQMFSLIFIIPTGIWLAANSYNIKIEDSLKAKRNFFYSNISGFIIWISILLAQLITKII